MRTLVRDPYAIYAQHILRLRSLSPLRPEADGRLKGNVFHAIMEQLFHPNAPRVTAERIEAVAKEQLEKDVPWPRVRTHWLGHLRDISGDLLAFQQKWLSSAEILKSEADGIYGVPGTAFNITGKADRIDRAIDGSLVIFDYKTGKIPRKKEIAAFDRQLLIEAVATRFA